MSDKILSKLSPSRGPGSPDVLGFYDAATGSAQYIVSDPDTRKAAVIDVVQTLDTRSYATGQAPGQFALEYLRDTGLDLVWILDTHPHADHLMASHWLKAQTGAPTAIGEKTREIAVLWRDLYNLPDAFDVAATFDRLFADGDRFTIGSIGVDVILSPGHTLGSVSYKVGDAIFAHDTLMQPDVGTARCDFPGGSAAALYDSIQRLLQYPDETRVFIGHDYGTKDRSDPAWESTVGAQKAGNAHIGGGTSKADYVALREARDATLSLPDRMLAALQVNLRGGALPPPEDDGHSYFKIPANRFAQR